MSNDNDKRDERAESTRVRTRTRSRTESDSKAKDDTKSDTKSDSTKGSSSKKDANGDDGSNGGGRRRRRRGRRGRRGKGRGRNKGGTQSKGGSRSKGGTDKPDGGKSSGGNGGKQQVKGSTRLAAKRDRTGSRRVSGVPEEVRRAILDGPPRTMLVSAREDRTQIAVLEDRTVVEHYVTRKDDVTYVGNIYMARVQNVLPGMEAAFLDIGKGRNGVLYAGEVLYDELDLEEDDDPRIEDALKPGQTVLVQVTKDPMGSKGPRLTMHLSLAGRYMVLAPNSPLFGISRKLTDKERDRLRKIVKRIKPDGHGVIVRTAAEGASDEDLEADLERLLKKWETVENAAEDAKALTSVYEEPPLVVKVIRDNFGPEFERCIIDSLELYEQVVGYLDEVAPELSQKVELYGPAKLEAAGEDIADREFAALFDAYNVSDQLRKAMGKKVWLPSGGYLIIEATEAMKVIDVNTGKFTGKDGQNLEEVVLKTNLEAAEEIVRQLRLRDMGGIIIIDFIDMLLKANQEQVVRKLKRELLRDRTKTRVSDVSRLGLVQMTRKNVSQGLVEAFSHTCEQCEGRGYVLEV